MWNTRFRCVHDLLFAFLLVMLGCGPGPSNDSGQGDAGPDLSGSVACVEGAGGPCRVDKNPCQSAAYTCTVDGPQCKATGSMPDGTDCGPGQICQKGSCNACADGMGCVPEGAPCHLGTLSCKPRLSCTDTGSAAPDGKACGANQVCGGGLRGLRGGQELPPGRQPLPGRGDDL